LVETYDVGNKLLSIYNTKYIGEKFDIPPNLSILELFKLQSYIWKLDGMASKVNSLNPKGCKQS